MYGAHSGGPSGGPQLRASEEYFRNLTIDVKVSGNILKNGMGVGIPEPMAW